MDKLRVGFLPAHRSVFNKEWAIKMKERTLNALSKIDFIEVITTSSELTKYGLITNEDDARKAINLFTESKIDALLIGTMTFGEELPIITVVESFRNKPIALFGTKEGPFTSEGGRNSDSFCGTLSISSDLHRRDIPFLFLGIIFPEEEIFKNKIVSFIRTCNAIKGFKDTKVGLIGPKPYQFETCTINEAILINRFGIRIQPVSLLSLNEEMQKIDSNNKEVNEIIEEIESTANCKLIGRESLIKLVKMEIVLKNYIRDENFSSLALSCWPDIPNIINVMPCLIASRLTGEGIPTACEADIYGALTMLIQYLLSLGKKVPNFIDWTIQSQDEDNLFLSWHCGNAPMCLVKNREQIFIKENSAAKEVFGEGNTIGTVEFQLKSGLVELNRLMEYKGEFKMLITKGNVINKPMKLRGSWSWVKVTDLEKLYNSLIREGFVHHASSIYDDNRQPMTDFCELLNIKGIII